MSQKKITYTHQRHFHALAEDFSIERNEELTKLAKEIFDIGR